MRVSKQILTYYRDLILVLTTKEIKVKYKSSFLGYLWSLLNPLSLALVFFFAFKFVIRIQIENYTLFLLAGLFPWQWFSTSIAAASTVLLGNASLIKKVNFPRYFIPLATVLNDAFHFIVSLPIIFGFVITYKISPTVDYIYEIPIISISQFFLTYGCALIVSSVNLFFRDLERLVMIALNIIFYLTPIIYDINLVPEKYRVFFFLNPLFGIIESWHNLFLRGHINWNIYLVSLIQSLAILGIGLLVFRKLSWKFAEVV